MIAVAKTLISLAGILFHLWWGTVQVSAAIARSNFEILKCVVVANFLVLRQVCNLWLLIGSQAATALRFAGVVVLVRVISVVAHVAEVFLEEWRKHQLSGQGGQGQI